MNCMAVYKFRISLEEDEDIVRDIEIRATQTFEDLHYAILSAIGFDTQHQASFFVSDDAWRKGQEITLKEYELAQPKKPGLAPPPLKLMSKSKISAFVESPHQRFIYIYDFQVQWVFLVELIKILPEDSGKKYPVCVKSVGLSPRQYPQVPVGEPVLDSEIPTGDEITDPLDLVGEPEGLEEDLDFEAEESGIEADEIPEGSEEDPEAGEESSIEEMGNEDGEKQEDF